ncbi:unnamed protein product [Closterium sp. Naga37s-1]|nr:unnamed protein product [Closterium sp. Naga37s-1]
MYGGGDFGGGDFGGGGASQFGGGGFMPTTPGPPGGAGGAAGVYSPNAGGRRPNNVNTLFPVTVREIANAGVRDTTENSLFINGHDATNMVLVGKVARRDDHETDVSIVLDDSTGKIEVRRWIDRDTNELATLETVRPGAYVRVHGHVRLQNNKRYVIAHAVRPVTDFNEVTFHFLDAIFVYLHTRKTGGGADGTEASPHQPPQRPQQPAYNQYVPPPAPAAAGAAGGMGGGGGAFGGAGGGAGGGRGVELRDRIMQFYESPQNATVQQGIHHQQVAQSMPDVSPQEIRSTVEYLTNTCLPRVFRPFDLALPITPSPPSPRLVVASATSSRTLLTMRPAGQRAFHVSAMMGEEARRFQSGGQGQCWGEGGGRGEEGKGGGERQPSARVFVDHTVYKGKGALSFVPIAPRFRVTQTGAYALAREGSVLLNFSNAIGTRKYDWDNKQNFSLSVSEIGSVLGLNPEDKLDFYHDPAKGRSEEGQVQKVLRIQPFNDFTGFYFSLNVKDARRGVDDRFSVPVTKAEFIVVRSAMNFILPHLMGWNALVSPGSIDPSMMVPSAPSSDNNWQ